MRQPATTHGAGGITENAGRIMTAALVGGLVLFTVAAWVFTTGYVQRPELRWVVVLGWLVVGPIAFLLPPARARVVRHDAAVARRTIDQGLVPIGVASAYLVGLAMAEGYGLLGAAYLFLSGDPAALIAPGIAIPLMLLNAPTLDKARRALETVA